jgi:hypothetical protein
MMVLFAILAVVCALNVLAFTPESIMSGLVLGLMYGYFFVVTYSLYDMFESEYLQRGFTAQYHQPGPKPYSPNMI